jgi:hypothetical protein
MNQHFKPIVLINHDIYPFDGECNVMLYSFVTSCNDFLVILCTCIQHRANALDPIRNSHLSALRLV